MPLDQDSRLYGKYHIEKADGTPIDPAADYFVLRIDKDPAARAAALAYAFAAADVAPLLAADLRGRVYDYQQRRFAVNQQVRIKSTAMCARTDAIEKEWLRGSPARILDHDLVSCMFYVNANGMGIALPEIDLEEIT